MLISQALCPVARPGLAREAPMVVCAALEAMQSPLPLPCARSVCQESSWQTLSASLQLLPADAVAAVGARC
jgi:hypothetical protein